MFVNMDRCRKVKNHKLFADDANDMQICYVDSYDLITNNIMLD